MVGYFVLYKVAFVRSVDKRDYGHSFQRMITHLHSFYGQTSLFKRRFANLPKGSFFYPD